MPDITVNVQNQAVQVNLENLSAKSGTLYLRDGVIHESKFSLGRSFLALFSPRIRAENAAASNAVQQALGRTYDVRFDSFSSKLSGSDITRLSDRARAANLARCQQSIQSLRERYGALADPAANEVRQSREFASGTVTHQMLENMNSAAELAKKQELQSIRTDLCRVPAEGPAMSGPQLMARLRALGRRSTQKIQQDVVEVGEFTLNRTAKVLKKKDKVIQLSPREFQIFDLLAQNIGIVVPRDIILDRIWGLESDVSSNNIDSYMKILRKKLDLGDGGTVIKTVRGVGYKLEARS